MLICLCILDLLTLFGKAHIIDSINAWHRLQSGSRANSDAEIEQLSAKLWSPNTKFDTWLNRNFFSQHEMKYLEPKLFTSSERSLIRHPHFSWSSADLLSLAGASKSYMILGGSVESIRSGKNKASVFPRDDGIVVVCIFTKTLNEEIHMEEPCQELSSGIDSKGFLGASVLAAKITPSYGLLAYCDPHWTKGSPFPAGRCFLHLIAEGRIRARHDLRSLCQTGARVTEPCMTGFSLGLSARRNINHSTYQEVRDIGLFVGQPLATRYGRAQIVYDPFHDAQTITIDQNSNGPRESPGRYFGYAYSDQYITAPTYGVDDFTNFSDPKLLRIFHYDDRNFREYSKADWHGLVRENISFSGFGTSIVRLESNTSTTFLVVGAPYASVNSFQSNRGLIFLYCIHDFAVNKNGFTTPQTHYQDFIWGPPESRFFGFSLSNMGDLDGDGVQDLAVGAPQLTDTDQPGNVFILRVLPNCSFDRKPLHILQGPRNEAYFGAILPPKSADINFNGWPDLVIPIPNCKHCKSLGAEPTTPVLYSFKPRYYAKCKFTFPRWLRTSNINERSRIPLNIDVYLFSLLKFEPQKSFLDIVSMSNSSIKDLVHQVNPDIWAKTSDQQRLQLERFDSTRLDKISNKLQVSFTLRPKMPNMNMPSLEEPAGGITVQYRFLIPCLPYSSSVNQTCTNKAWLNQKFIDWTGCNILLPITRYVCYERERCESNIKLKVVDVFANNNISWNNSTTTTSATGQTLLTYGDKDMSKTLLHIEVYNFGPTVAYGARLHLKFFGHLHFSSLEFRIKTKDGRSKFSKAVCNHTAENETQFYCNIGRLEAPFSSLEGRKKHPTAPEPVILFRLSSFYNMNEDALSGDYKLDSKVNISLTTSTWDPLIMDNTIIWKFTSKHVPKILISTESGVTYSIMDNRKLPVPRELARYQRVRVDDIGPQLQHAFQIENLGKQTRLKNVTVRIKIPVATKIPGSTKSLLYLFDEVRSPVGASGELDWFSIGPSFKQLGDDESNRYMCTYADDKLVNPKKHVGIFIDNKLTKRIRRNADVFNKTDYSNESTAYVMEDGDPEPSIRNTISFRRTPKEILQCGRVGGFFGNKICLEIICHIDELVRQRPVLLTVNSWLDARTFFDHGISDIEVVTSVTVDQGDVPMGVLKAEEPAGYFELSQTVFFSQMETKVLSRIPIWPIVVGLNLGIILLALLSVLLYCHGFFRRRSKSELVATDSSRIIEARSKTKHSNSAKATPDYGYSFGTLTTLEEARRRRRKMRKHPEEVSILHPDDLRNVHINFADDKNMPPSADN